MRTGMRDRTLKALAEAREGGVKRVLFHSPRGVAATHTPPTWVWTEGGRMEETPARELVRMGVWLAREALGRKDPWGLGGVVDLVGNRIDLRFWSREPEREIRLPLEGLLEGTPLGMGCFPRSGCTRRRARGWNSGSGPRGQGRKAIGSPPSWPPPC